MAYLNKRRRYARKRGPVRAKRTGAKSTRIFKKKVLAIIHKNTENKQGFRYQNTTSYNSGIDTSADIAFLVPNVAQGPEENARNGDRIRAQKLTLKGILQMNLSYANTYSGCRIGVRVFVVQPKLFTNQPSILANANNWLPYLLRKGASSLPFSGVISDLACPVNREMITCYYDKVFYMTIPYMATAAGQQETYHSTKFFNKTFKLRNKELKYNSNYESNLQPTNYAPVIIVGYVHLDGTAPDVVNQQLTMSWDSILDYEDA